MSMVNSSVQFFLHFWYKHTLFYWQLGIQLLIIIPVITVTASLILPYFRLYYFWFYASSCLFMQQVLIQRTAEHLLWCIVFSASLFSKCRGHCVLFPQQYGEHFLNWLYPIQKHTLSEGNEAEHYVMYGQEVKQFPWVSSNFLVSLFRLFLRVISSAVCHCCSASVKSS